MYIWGKGRAACRVGSDFLSAIAGRVGSGQGFAGSGLRKVTRGQLRITMACCMNQTIETHQNELMRKTAERLRDSSIIFFSKTASCEVQIKIKHWKY